MVGISYKINIRLSVLKGHISSKVLSQDSYNCYIAFGACPRQTIVIISTLMIHTFYHMHIIGEHCKRDSGTCSLNKAL